MCPMRRQRRINGDAHPCQMARPGEPVRGVSVLGSRLISGVSGLLEALVWIFITAGRIGYFAYDGHHIAKRLDGDLHEAAQG